MRILDTTIVLLLTGLFVLLSVGTMVLGISIYNHTNQVSINNYEKRTALSFIANQVRMNDVINCISVKPFHDVNALVLSQDIDGTAYQTLLYCYDGQLREIFTEEGILHQPEAGNIIMPLKSLYIESYGNAIRINVLNPSGITESLILYPRSDPNSQT